MEAAAHAAASALMARLSVGEPAGCLAEEVLAVTLMDIASELIDLNTALGDGRRGWPRPRYAACSSSSQDDDVLSLFDMAEPAVAALAGHDPINRQLGVGRADRAWFEPFSWTVPTGHLDELRPCRSP